MSAIPAQLSRDPLPAPAPVRGIDVTAILAAIPGDHPAGGSVRMSGDYDRIRAARREDDPALPQGVWQTDIKRANWDEVVRLCTEALAQRSKDVQIACWLTEALSRRDGFAGLGAGLGILQGLCEAFWPALFPEIEGTDLSYRVAPFEWINAHLPATLFRIPLTVAGVVTPDVLAFEHYANALRLEQIYKANPNTKPGTGIRLAAFDAAVAATPVVFYRGLQRQIDTCLGVISALDRLLDEKCGKQAPSLSALRSALVEIGNLVQTVMHNKGGVLLGAETATSTTPAAEAAPSVNDEAVAEQQAVAEPFNGVIRDRNQAYDLLLQISEYLSRVEPHSPTPYLLRRAYSWGMMPLHELLTQMTKGGKDFNALLDLLGLERSK